MGSTKMRGAEGDRWTFTASGPVTILAARLSEYGRGGQTWIGEETASRVREGYPLTPMGKVPFKNLDDSGEIYEVKGPSNGH
ncbi:MAG: hypothetical protein JRJ82_13975 [Deltaproteobacteria bacterium]|nr:hypothetical protein [Deltaproteobacteria bacterium]